MTDRVSTYGLLALVWGACTDAMPGQAGEDAAPTEVADGAEVAREGPRRLPPGVPCTPRACDDGDVCTADACDGLGECVHKDLSAHCPAAGPCRAAICHAEQGCVYEAVAGACNDGDPCTTGDHCAAGACQGTPPLLDDHNPCTQDLCTAAGTVVHAPRQGACEDGDACTVGDGCALGACVGGSALPCDDRNPCTTDACSPALGCLHVPNQAWCDDGDTCTTLDACSGGTCLGGPAGDCDDGNACTKDTCDPVTGCAHKLLATGACRPQILVTEPARAAALTASIPYLWVSGTVSSGAGPVTELRVNGVLAYANGAGAFATLIAPSIGGNTLVVEATDALGSTERVVQSFHWASAYQPPPWSASLDSPVTSGLLVYLSAGAIDDGVHTLPPDDLATLAEQLIAALDLAALVPSPALDGDSYAIHLTNLQHGPTVVSLTPIANGLRVEAWLPDVKANVQAYGKQWYTPNLTGTLTMTGLALEADLGVKIAGHQLAVELVTAAVTAEGLDLDADGFWGWLLDWLLDWVVEGYVPTLEQTLASLLQTKLAPVLQDALGSLALAFDVEVPGVAAGKVIDLEVGADFLDREITPGGAEFALRAGAFAPDGVAYALPGSLLRHGCGSGPQALEASQTHPLEMVVGDDALNALLFALWRGGLLEGQVPADLLDPGLFVGTGLESAELHLSAMLPPVVSDCHPQGALRVHLGDLRIDASLALLGQVVEAVIYASLEADVAGVASQAGLGLEVTSPLDVEIEVQTLDEAFWAVKPALVLALEQKLLPKLLDRFKPGTTLASFPLPAIELSGVGGLPMGTAITLKVKSVYRSPGATHALGQAE